MSKWISNLSSQIATFYIGLAKGLAILYLTFVIPFIVAAQFMRWFNVGHIDDSLSDEALPVAIVLTIFLLVLKIAGDTDEIKNRRSRAMTNDLAFYGFPDECKKFQERHPVWGEMMENLDKAANVAFTRVQVMDGAADKLVYFFGRIVLEDFLEISLVCHHGYGVAASKLLRSMYEYAVTLHYLHDHPDEAEAFMAYHFVQQDKLASRMIETFGENVLPAAQIAETRRKAAEVKQDFMIPDCEHEGAKMRLNHTWNRLDFVAMAKKTGELGTLVVPGYYMPMRHTHPTFGGLTERLEVVEGRMGLNAEAQPEIADTSLRTAHNCLLNTLEVQALHFKIQGLEEAMQVCFLDFYRMWSPDSAVLKHQLADGGRKTKG